MDEKAASEITYSSYLKIKELRSLQSPRSSPACHDEMHFIIVHQVFELWFKLMLHEVDAIGEHVREGRAREATHLFRRLNAILNVFLPQIEVIETMRPTDFLAFRDMLKPASGFQSVQFRELEFASGARDERYVKMFEDDPGAQERLRARLARPSLWQCFVEGLRARGLPRDERAAVLEIYREGKHADLRDLCEEMIQYDERFSLWREHHVRMAERMIGRKAGTGQKSVVYALGEKPGPMGTMGVEYLQKTLDKRFFPILWAARTDL
ncbi:MAG: tryptophan 2,3-dioxygenase [Planctomycetes bacterium]|nr:tryptophan 2,3-dioxygenase [Planctomycetota bacterium]